MQNKETIQCEQLTGQSIFLLKTLLHLISTRLTSNTLLTYMKM